MKRIFATIFLLFALQNAWALDLHSAKDQGLVGEANNGYLASVGPSPSAEVMALIEEVNAKRRMQFTKAAEKTTATLEQVSFRFYQLAIEKTRPGHYYQDANGNWQKK